MPISADPREPSLEAVQPHDALELTDHWAYECLKNSWEWDEMGPLQPLEDPMLGHRRHNVENNSEIERAKARKALEKAKALEAIQLAQGAKWVREGDGTWILRKAHEKKRKRVARGTLRQLSGTR